jgi:hypothetical protein
VNTVITSAAPLQLTSWAPPAWTDSIVADGSLIVCSRTLGAVPELTGSGSGGDALSVILVQRDELRTEPHRIDVVRHPAEILVGGVSLTATEGQELSRLIEDAIELLGGGSPGGA